MNNISFSAWIACAILLLCSCSKAKNISVDNDKVTFSIVGGEKSVNVTADGSYDVKDCPDWLKASSSDSTLTFTAEENKTGAARECVVSLVGADNLTVPITVRQADKCTYISVSENEVVMPKEGGTKELTIDTDGDGVAVQTTEGFKADINGDKVTINAPANPKGKIEGQLILRCDSVKTIVNVIVQGAICGRCNGTGKITCPKCGGKGHLGRIGSEELFEGCTKCGGTPDFWFGEYSPDGHPGSGRITCPDCGGTGIPNNLN